MIERICTKRMFALLLAVGAIWTSLPAHAESCGARDVMVERLQANYKERLAGGGLHGENAVVEVWASSETGTFTVLSTDTQGQACIIATGTNWQAPTLVKLSSS